MKEKINKLNEKLTFQVKKFEKNDSLENIIMNQHGPIIHNMNQEMESEYILDEAFCDPDLSSLINYEKDLNGARSN